MKRLNLTAKVILGTAVLGAVAFAVVFCWLLVIGGTASGFFHKGADSEKFRASRIEKYLSDKYDSEEFTVLSENWVTGEQWLVDENMYSFTVKDSKGNEFMVNAEEDLKLIGDTYQSYEYSNQVHDLCESIAENYSFTSADIKLYDKMVLRKAESLSDYLKCGCRVSFDLELRDPDTNKLHDFLTELGSNNIESTVSVTYGSSSNPAIFIIKDGNIPDKEKVEAALTGF